MATHGAEKGHRANPGHSITVLSVSPVEDDHAVLEKIVVDGKLVLRSNIHTALSLEAAVSAVQIKGISVVLCEAQLLACTWKDLLQHISLHPDPPLMIVTSLHADDEPLGGRSTSWRLRRVAEAV